MKIPKIRKIIISALLTAALLLSGCGSEAPAPSVHYEKVLDTISAAVKAKDTDAYLLCFTDAARLNYQNSDRYDRDLASKFIPSENGEQSAMIFTVTDHRELNNEEITTLENAYKDKYAMRIDITKAYELKTTVSSGVLRTERTFNAVNTGTGWVLLGPVIENWFDAPALASQSGTTAASASSADSSSAAAVQ